MIELNRKPKLGLVSVASHDESGGQRAESFLQAAKEALAKAGIDAYVAETTVWTPAEALQAAEELNGAGIDALAVVHITWIMDSLSYILVNKVKVPTALWAVPYTETFALGCVQHMGATLKMQNIPYVPVYGHPDDEKLLHKLKTLAEAGYLINSLRRMNLALLGPRQTWRVAGPQDMSMEEWEFSHKFGTTILHLEMDEVTDRVAKISDADAQKTLDMLAARTGKAVAPAENMLYAAKGYMALHEIMKLNQLEGVAAECYPKFDGLTNLTASWMADEGKVIETEGDIAHVMLRQAMNQCHGDAPSILGEAGSFDPVTDVIAVSHGGSSATAVTEDISQVQVSPSGEIGTYVGTPVKAMPVVTVANLTGQKGNYQMLIAKAETVPVSQEEWDDAGRRLLVKLRFKKNAGEVMDIFMNEGIDHHLVIREGDCTDTLAMMCDFLGIKKIEL